MNVLVTGAFGYIGNEVINVLIKSGFNVVANDNCKKSAEIFYPFWYKKIKYIHQDVCEIECPKDIDFIVHLAAEVGYLKCDTDPERTIKTNVEGVRRISSFYKPTLFFSTGSVYGKVTTVCNESTCCDPQTLYAKTKLEGEKIIKDVPHCIVRPATAYGISYKVRHDLLVHHLVKMALSGKVDLFEPKVTRSIYNVKKIAEFVCHCIKNWKIYEGQIINLGSKKDILTKISILEKISKYCDFSIKYTDKEDPDKRNYSVDYSKLSSTWDDSEDEIENNLEEIVNYYKLLC